MSASFASRSLSCHAATLQRISRETRFSQKLGWQRFFLTTAASELPRSTQKAPTDPTARRPNQVCDPYGQGGKPLAAFEAKSLMATIHKEWELVETDDGAPVALQREFVHTDFLQASKFLHRLAAVAEMNAHFPSLHLERRIVQKNWVTVSTARCHTTVLKGLSRHDFHLAMVR